MVHRNQLFTVFEIFYIFVLISLTATYVRCQTRIDTSNKSPQQQQQQQQVLNSCVVPKFNGTEYFLAGCVGETACSLEAGHRIRGNGSVLRFKCAESFILRQKQVDITVCYDGHWFPKRHSCQRTCKAIDLNTLDMACSYKGQAVSCVDDVRVGTQAAIACKQGFITDRNYEMRNHCLKTGKWKYVMYNCAPICGEMEGDRMKQEELRNAIDTIDARQAPWNAAVYLAENATFRMICGGTLLSEEFIITAAKCVKNESGYVRDLSVFGVAVGKTYKNWDDSRDSSVAQKFQVTEILDEAYFRQFFKGDSEIIDFARHIVVLRVKGVINFGSLVSPVCLDVERLNERVPNLVGTVIGWSVKDDSSMRLTRFRRPVENNFACKGRLKPNETIDNPSKFCTERIHQLGNYLGAGLTFWENETRKNYVIGILTDHFDDVTVYLGYRDDSSAFIIDLMRIYFARATDVKSVE